VAPPASRADDHDGGAQPVADGLQVETDLREHIREWIGAFVARHLFAVAKAPLGELFVYDQVAPLRQAFEQGPKDRLERLFRNFGEELGCTACDTDEAQGVAACSEDATLAFQVLFRNSGFRVGLNEWFRGFKELCVLQAQPQQQPDAKRHKPQSSSATGAFAAASTATNSKVYEARFQKAINELKQLGFCKPNSRAPNTASILVWVDLEKKKPGCDAR
jgi:hypothetical protein